MPKISKRHRANQSTTPKQALDIPSAVAALKKFKGPKFDQSVNVVVHLGIDPKQADQALRGSISLPKGTGRSARVVCFCSGDKVADAKAAGAVEAGAEDLVSKIEGGWMDFDVAVASPDMMRVVSRLGKVLGPKGLMPSPKAGTVTPDVASAVREYSAGKQEFRNDDGGNIHCVIGKMSFPEGDLATNLEAFIAHINRIRPSAAKGQYIKKCVISGTMSPGVLVAV
ncbi:MAG TPA: 50S ribosomal protein L1 [Phycisphaerales bacterium]|nr:50S ribosomal protein L1 [Phycisphaerales bacterium]HMP38702.1 50S ribosomal protein L1 [Phycisphaerales bacterium]